MTNRAGFCLRTRCRVIRVRLSRQAYEPDEHRYDDILYEHAHDERAYADHELYAADEEYKNEAPRVRRHSLTFAAAIFGLAVLGTAGALGYRAMFGGSVLPIIRASNEPNRVTASSESQASNSSTASQAGAATTGSIKNLVSHEEQPVAIEPPKSAPGVISTIPIATGQGSLPGTRAARMRPLPVRRCRTKRCRPAWRLRLLPSLLLPRLLRRSAVANRVHRTSRLAARIRLPPPSHFPMRTALRP